MGLAISTWATLAWLQINQRERSQLGLTFLTVLWVIGILSMIGGAASARSPLESSISAGAWFDTQILGLVAVIWMASLSIPILLATSPFVPDRTTRSIWLAGIVFSAGIFLSGIFGQVPGLPRGIILFPITLTVLSTVAKPNRQDTIDAGARITLCFVYGSLAYALLFPSRAILNPYGSLIGIGSRLLGLTGGGTALGGIAALALLLIANSSLKWRLFHLGPIGLVLIWSQSKAAWIAAFLGVVVLMLQRSDRGARRLLLYLSFTCVVTIPIFVSNGVDGLADWSVERSGNRQDLGGLNSRTGLWSSTLDVWQKYKVFGYGPEIWSEAFRSSFLGRYDFAGNAHNQWIQALGQTGLVGLTCLIFYVTILAKVAYRARTHDGGLGLALLAALLVRTLTEVPMSSISIDASFFIHVFTIAYLMVSMQFVPYRSIRFAHRSEKPRVRARI